MKPFQSWFSRFAAYASVGVVGTATQYAVLSALMLFHACGAVIASGLGSITGALINYILNYHLTFRTTASHNKTAPRFFTIAATGVALNSMLMFMLTDRLPLGWLAAQCITSVCVLILTYGANSLWTFRACKA